MNVVHCDVTDAQRAISRLLSSRGADVFRVNTGSDDNPHYVRLREVAYSYLERGPEIEVVYKADALSDLCGLRGRQFSGVKETEGHIKLSGKPSS